MKNSDLPAFPFIPGSRDDQKEFATLDGMTKREFILFTCFAALCSNPEVVKIGITPDEKAQSAFNHCNALCKYIDML